MVQTGHAAAAAVMAAPASDGERLRPPSCWILGEGGEKTFPISFRAVSKCRGRFRGGTDFLFSFVPFSFSLLLFPHSIFRYITKILAAFPEMLASLQNLILLPMGLKLPVPFMLEFRRKSKIFKVGLVSQDSSTNPYFHK